MSDPRAWDDENWQQFFDQHTNSQESVGEAVQNIMDIMTEADDGNYNNTVGNVAPEEE